MLYEAVTWTLRKEDDKRQEAMKVFHGIRSMEGINGRIEYDTRKYRGERAMIEKR